MKKYFVVGALSLAIAGCSGFLSGKSNLAQPKELNSALINQSSISQLWGVNSKASTTARTGLRFQMAHDASNLYVAGANGAVSAIDLSSGALRWSRSVGKLSAGVGAGSGVVLVGDRDGNLIALSSADGTEKWRKRLLGPANAAPIASHGRAIVRSMSGAVEAFNLETGEEDWAYVVGRPEMNIRGGAQPQVVGNELFIPNDIGQVGVLDVESGKVLWGTNLGKVRDGSLMGQLRDVDAAPIITENRLFAATVKDGITATNKQGKRLWSAGEGVYAGFAYDGRALYAVEHDSKIRALNSDNGAQLWTNEDLTGRWLTEPQVINQRIVVGDLEGYVHQIESTTGQLISSTKVAKSGFLPDTLQINGTMILMDRTGGIYRIGL